MKIRNYLKRNYLILIILILGLILRLYKAQELFLYGHDNDLAGWFVRDVVENIHLRLIGQETSTQGIFIGPLYYYLLVPFYLLTGMDPIGGVILVTSIGLFSIWSVYWVFSKIFEKNTGLIGAFIYATSYYVVFNDREVVPTMPVILWTVWFLYAIHLLLKRNIKRGLILSGILIGLIWNLNFALILTVPLLVVALFLQRKRFDKGVIFSGALTLLVTSLPLLLFEVKHGFIQSKALLVALTTPQRDIFSGSEKLQRVIHLASKNISGFLWGDIGINYTWAATSILLIFFFLTMKRIIKREWVILFSVWIVSYIAFFSLYSKAVSEYYLNGITVVWITLFTLFLSYLTSIKKYKKLAIIILGFFFVSNAYRILSVHVNKNGYLYRKALVKEIKADAQRRGYPCVAVSYITNPGYDLGYRYFFYLENMHVNKPNSGSPVYTVVFPLNEKLFPVHKTFGALGLIYPDYGKYGSDQVTISCSGANSNLTDPMFGFTK